MSRKRMLAGLIAAGVVAVAAVAAVESGGIAGNLGRRVPAVTGAVSAVAARAELAGLTVAPARPGGYERAKDFGPAWSYDYDRNGCRARDDVLRRDLSQIRTQGRCTVVAGVLADPYTGRTIVFTKARAAAVQIDHVYPLAAAWAHGARAWTPDQWLRLANDPANLLAVDGPTNESKGDRTPAQWQPRPAFRCAYAQKYIGVARRYRLTVAAADKAALGAALGTCPGGGR
jgi:hypothetical protein